MEENKERNIPCFPLLQTKSNEKHGIFRSQNHETSAIGLARGTFFDQEIRHEPQFRPHPHRPRYPLRRPQDGDGTRRLQEWRYLVRNSSGTPNGYLQPRRLRRHVQRETGGLERSAMGSHHRRRQDIHALGSTACNRDHRVLVVAPRRRMGRRPGSKTANHLGPRGTRKVRVLTLPITPDLRAKAQSTSLSTGASTFLKRYF